jgi:hypothetical protein
LALRQVWLYEEATAAVISVGENGSIFEHVTETPVGSGHSGNDTASPPHLLMVIFRFSVITYTLAVPISVVVIIAMCI